MARHREVDEVDCLDSPFAAAVDVGPWASTCNTRACDSREDPAGAVLSESRRLVSVADGSLPGDAVGVIATVTAVNGVAEGFVTALATATDAGGEPLTSTVNFEPDQVRGNQVAVFVPVTAAREFTLYAKTEVDGVCCMVR